MIFTLQMDNNASLMQTQVRFMGFIEVMTMFTTLFIWSRVKVHLLIAGFMPLSATVEHYDKAKQNG